MATVVQSAKIQPAWRTRNSLTADDEGSRGMGDLAREQLQRLGYSVQNYYRSSETLLQYPPAFDAPLSVINTSLIEKIAKKQLGGTLAEIDKLLTWDAGWNGYTAPEPDSKAVIRARQWITSFFQEVVNLGWLEPNITSGSEGEVVFEWWYGQHKLTIYVGEQSTEYVQVWGTNIDSKITDGDIESANNYRVLWMWLMD